MTETLTAQTEEEKFRGFFTNMFGGTDSARVASRLISWAERININENRFELNFPNEKNKDLMTILSFGPENLIVSVENWTKEKWQLVGGFHIELSKQVALVDDDDTVMLLTGSISNIVLIVIRRNEFVVAS